MAISNMYKPGWRSRRRSRLSLVERAVPRLGRTPGSEQGSNAPSSGTTEPSAAEVEQTIEIHDHIETTPASEHAGKWPDPASPIRAETFAPSTSRQSETDAELLPNAGQMAPHSPDQAESETAPSSETEQTELIAEKQESGKPAFSAFAPSAAPAKERLRSVAMGSAASGSVALVETGHGRNDDGVEPQLPRVLEGKLDIEGMSAAVQAKAEPTGLQLDWTSLIASGLIDPRNRSQPLPANMDEIARALVRQALSDQSSWRDRIILVTSAREDRPKSMAALNFAFALTTIDRHSVALLDANMDEGGVGAYLGATAQNGLTKALCDSNLEVGDIVLKTNLDRLTLVTSGDFEEDILDRFASRRMLEILRFLTKDPNTLLVIDAPPILSSQETTILSVIAGQVVVVVEAGKTDEDSIRLALKRIGDRHNVSLVLSNSAGIKPTETTVVEPGTQHRRRIFAGPKKTMIKRRLRKAVASFIISLGLGLSSFYDVDRQQDQGLFAPTMLSVTLLNSRLLKMKPAFSKLSSIV